MEITTFDELTLAPSTIRKYKSLAKTINKFLKPSDFNDFEKSKKVIETIFKMEKNKLSKQKVRMVFSVVVKTKHFLSDMFQNLKNMVGMNLTAYEKMIEDALGEAYDKLITKYPEVYDIKFTTSQVSDGACEIICYGKIKI